MRTSVKKKPPQNIPYKSEESKQGTNNTYQQAFQIYPTPLLF